ncbi:hypothetical protein [uncultured Clostridium sp.]|uniref:hypothetical protein n=1 Tax=uncultured Clostridium sp. TaxID=59620 RepID=UPI0032165E85
MTIIYCDEGMCKYENGGICTQDSISMIEGECEGYEHRIPEIFKEPRIFKEEDEEDFVEKWLKIIKESKSNNE